MILLLFSSNKISFISIIRITKVYVKSQYKITEV